jgi:DNA-binding XRE family transcriptional regulator
MTPASAPILGVRKARTTGWTSGVVHLRERHGKPGLELRAARHHVTLRMALESLGTADRVNGHGGCESDLLAGTAGAEAADRLLRDFLAAPGETLESIRLELGLSRAEWSRRSGVHRRTIRRITHEGQVPLLTTARRLLEALQ